jgi:hypothetical protein
MPRREDERRRRGCSKDGEDEDVYVKVNVYVHLDTKRRLVARLPTRESRDLADKGVVARLDDDAVAFAGDDEGRVEEL